MKRFFPAFLLAALLLSLSACGQTTAVVSGSSISESASPADSGLTEADVLAAYGDAAQVYDWFSLCSLPDSGETVTEAGKPYEPYGPDDPDGTARAYHPVSYPGLTTYAELETKVRSLFAPTVADCLLKSSNYLAINGKLHTLGGARGSNIDLIGKTAAAVQSDADHWTVTVTFYADSYALDAPNAIVGYSQTTLNYAHTADGWRFTNFCSSDALDETADTVFTFSYGYGDRPLDATDADCTDLKLALYLLHADGAFSEGPSDDLSHRFLADPAGWFSALSVFVNSPWEHAQTVMKAPAYDIYAWFTAEEQAQFENILSTYQPKNSAEQALLDGLQAAKDAAIQGAAEDAAASFCLVVNDQYLTLGRKEGKYPWGYTAFPTTPQSAGKGDNGEQVYAFSYEELAVTFSVNPDDGGSMVYRMSTTSPAVRTLQNLSVGDTLSAVQTALPGVVEYGALQPSQPVKFDTVYVYEPGGFAYCKHTAFFLKDGVVVCIEMEDLMDGRLVSDS